MPRLFEWVDGGRHTEGSDYMLSAHHVHFGNGIEAGDREVHPDVEGVACK